MASNSDIPGAVLQRGHIHNAACAPGTVDDALRALRDSPKTTAQKAKFVLATDGESFHAEDQTGGSTIAFTIGIGDVVSGGRVKCQAMVVRKKTGRPVQFELTKPARNSLTHWLDVQLAFDADQNPPYPVLSMSIQTQAILSGHIRPEEIVTAIASRTGCDVSMRPMHRQTYKLIEFIGPAGQVALHVFLESSVAEDYWEVTDGPSTLVSAENSTLARETVKLLASEFGGFYRGSEQYDWEWIAPSLSS